MTSAASYAIEYAPMDVLAVKLKRYRASKGCSQEQLARALGVSLNTVQRWESGKTRPSPLAIEKLRLSLGDNLDQNQIRLFGPDV